MRYRFGDHDLDTETGELIGPSGPIELRRRTFRLLRVLVEKAPALVRHDELLDEVWGRTALSANALSQAISELRQALGDSARSARYIETRHGRGYRLKVPVERVETAQETGQIAEHRAEGGQPQQRRWPLAPLAVVAALLLLVPVVWWLAAPEPETLPSDNGAGTEVLALGRLAADDGVPDWVAPAALELMLGRLGNDPSLVVIRQDAQGLAGGPDDSRWRAAMREVHGAGLAVDGRWRIDNDQRLQMALNLVALDSGRLVHEWQSADDLDRLDRLVDEAVAQLRRALRLPPSTIGRPTLAGSEKAEQYWRGLAALAEGEHAQAVELLQHLYETSGRPAWLALHLARALRLAGASRSAAALFADIDEDTTGLALGESLRLHAELARLRHDAMDAASALRALSALFPQDMDLLLELAEAELDALQGEAARITLARAAVRDEAAGSPEFHRLRAELGLLDADYDSAMAAIDTAHALVETHGLVGMLVPVAKTRTRIHRARGELVIAEEHLAELRQRWGERLDGSRDQTLVIELAGLARARGQIAQAEELLTELSDTDPGSLSQLRVEIERALLDHDRGDFSTALERLDGIAPAVRELGNAEIEIGHGGALGMVLLARGDMSGAVSAFEQAMSLARRSGLGHRVAALQINFGQMLARQGRHAEAERIWEQAIEVFEQLGDRRGMAVSLGNLAASAAEQGLAERSRELNQRALAIFRELNLSADIARTAFNLALSASRDGDLAGADALFAEAESIYRQAGQTDLVLYVAALRADHLLLAGRLNAAEQLLDSLEQLIDSGSALRQSVVWSARGRLHQWRGEIGPAAEAFAKSAELRSASGHEGWIMTSRLEQLRLDLIAGHDPWSIRIESGEIAEGFASSSQFRGAARAWLLGAEALLSLGEQDDARELLERVRTSGEGFRDAALALDLAWVEAWAGRPEARQMRLERLGRRAEELGYVSMLRLIDVAASVNGLVLELGPVAPEQALTPAILPPYARQR